MDYQRVVLAGPTIEGEPGIPDALIGLAGESLADLEAALDPCPPQYAGIGYWPIQPAAPLPPNKVSVGRDREIIGGVVQWVDDLADAPRPTEAVIVAERARRLALGFDYDFDDARGIHHIGTTEADMRKWLDEVTPISQALINGGMANGEIGIFTDTGPVTVTAAEWQVILLAAGQWRQPIYQASFRLLTADPVPYDYTDDTHWL